MIKAAADWLLARYAEAKTPAPAEAVMLWHEVLGIKPTPRARAGARVHERLLDAYREAYLFDARIRSEPPLYAVAKHVRTKTKRRKCWDQEAAEARIRSWRKQPHYRDQVQLNRRTKG